MAGWCSPKVGDLFFSWPFFFESDFFKKPKKCQEKKLVSQEVFLAFFFKVEKIKIIAKDKNCNFFVKPRVNSAKTNEHQPRKIFG